MQEVNGGNGDEKFTLKAGGQDFLFDRVNLVPFTLNDKNIEKLEVNGSGGNDSFKVDEPRRNRPEGSLVQRRQRARRTRRQRHGSQIKAWGGDGNDKLSRRLRGNDELNGDSRRRLLVGNKGDDKHNGGHGNDTIVWNNGDGSDTNNGGSGNRHPGGQRRQCRG